MINGGLMVANSFIQEVVAEAIKIVEIIKNIIIQIIIELINRYLKIRAPFQKDPVPYLILKCDWELKRIRMEVAN